MRELTLLKIVHFIFLAYAWVLGTMAASGIVYMAYRLASGEINTANLTFGIFDTLG